MKLLTHLLKLLQLLPTVLTHNVYTHIYIYSLTNYSILIKGIPHKSKVSEMTSNRRSLSRNCKVKYQNIRRSDNRCDRLLLYLQRRLRKYVIDRYKTHLYWQNERSIHLITISTDIKRWNLFLLVVEALWKSKDCDLLYLKQFYFLLIMVNTRRILRW